MTDGKLPFDYMLDDAGKEFFYCIPAHSVPYERAFQARRVHCTVDNK